MYLLYANESGDAGRLGSPSHAFAIAFVVAQRSSDRLAHDDYTRFRDYLHTYFRIAPDWPLRVHDLLHQKGPIADLHLSPAAQMAVFRAIMRFQRNCTHLRTFAIAVDKRRLADTWLKPSRWSEPHLALRPVSMRWSMWLYALRWVERLTVRDGVFLRLREDWLIQDSGEPFVRVADHGGQHKYVSADEPLIQLASFNAYAACRVVEPSRRMDPRMWDELGRARVNDEYEERAGLLILPTKSPQAGGRMSPY